MILFYIILLLGIMLLITGLISGDNEDLLSGSFVVILSIPFGFICILLDDTEKTSKKSCNSTKYLIKEIKIKDSTSVITVKEVDSATFYNNTKF